MQNVLALVIPALQRQEPECGGFKVSLGYKVRPHLQKKKKRKVFDLCLLVLMKNASMGL